MDTVAMKNMFHLLPRPMLLSALLIAALGSTAALAQSGSSGGSIGNDEKSLSGTRTAPRTVTPSRPAQSKSSEAPRRAARKTSNEGGGNFDGSWVVVAQGSPCGSSTERLVISGGAISGELSSGHVSPNGSTTGSGSAGGLSWTSSGRFSGRSGSGSFVRSDGCKGHWTASKR
ncbi:hypothetical protein FDV58_32580 [Bradyrhizobium elkanii]|uniref:Uncharacterized protein n=2 Tax=Bradyrhizobium TaxID=374 RepID=A0A4U6RT57_BRAEL|nr:hypothetical protein [Bradyrhizobium sp. BR2003]TKV77298.1 hypothetical protein FDV58_32580 [Bradyrhizobium elkanii]